MIPHRIQMTGLLSYKQKQDVSFDGSPLWMLAGANGSGKSSIFDGVTYALFGYHRGGSQNSSELINKESPALAVEFDFQLDGELYRIKRTLRRSQRGTAAATQQILRNGPGGDWVPVPDTSKKADFDSWIREHVDLDYETFTSSVLLLQGKAEKLLDARPSGRAEVLAGIVHLRQYQKLYDRANQRKLDLKSSLEALQYQAEGVPDVPDEDYARADLKVEAGEDNRQEAQKQIDALREREARAREWSGLQARLDSVRLKLQKAESLLGEAAGIENAFARWQELRSVLPAVNIVVTMRAKSQESLRKTEQLQQHRKEAQDRRSQAEHDLALARTSKASLQATLATDEEKQSQVNRRLRELQGLLEKVRLIEQQEAELTRLDEELAKLPDNPERDVRDSQVEFDRLNDLNRILPILERFQTERHELTEARRNEGTSQDEQSRIQTDGEKKKAELAVLQPKVEQARQERSQADQAVAVANAQVEQARTALAEFTGLAGSPNCTACGQPLTKKHFAEEERKRQRHVETVEQHHRAALAAQIESTLREQELTTEESSRKQELEDLRIAYKEATAKAKQATADVKRLTEALALRHAEMPQPYRDRIARSTPADWTETQYPERDELIVLRRDVTQFEPARARLREATDFLTRWNQLKARADSVRETLHSLRTGLPGSDPAALRVEQSSLQGEEAALQSTIKAARLNLTNIETEIDKLGREGHTAVQHLTDLAGKLQTEEVTRTHCRESIDVAMKQIPANWMTPVEAAGLADYSTWKSEEDELSTAGTEAKYRQLEQARLGLNALKAEIAGLESETDQFKPEERRSPEEVREELARAREVLTQRDEELQTARREKATLDSYREQRVRLGEEVKKTERQFTRYKILSELLGRDRLQRHLVRQAERQIVDYANAVLDRLSGGQLFLRLVAGEDGASADKALDLECSNRVTGGTGINVAFLSGSQKFRVAVSLALGIGQYASRQHRPIESVIIDEGFGCLDRQGRQVMIQELQNLRGHLKCILLVSHQEEFADAFPDGYRFELENGATKVTRFQR